jgi:hypothetical protein
MLLCDPGRNAAARVCQHRVRVEKFPKCPSARHSLRTRGRGGDGKTRRLMLSPRTKNAPCVKNGCSLKKGGTIPASTKKRTTNLSLHDSKNDKNCELVVVFRRSQQQPHYLLCLRCEAQPQTSLPTARSKLLESATGECHRLCSHLPPVSVVRLIRFEDVARSARGRYTARDCRAGCGRTRCRTRCRARTAAARCGLAARALSACRRAATSRGCRGGRGCSGGALGCHVHRPEQ